MSGVQSGTPDFILSMERERGIGTPSGGMLAHPYVSAPPCPPTLTLSALGPAMNLRPNWVAPRCFVALRSVQTFGSLTVHPKGFLDPCGYSLNHDTRTWLDCVGPFGFPQRQSVSTLPRRLFPRRGKEYLRSRSRWSSSGTASQNIPWTTGH